jgi:hypothetical protein
VTILAVGLVAVSAAAVGLVASLTLGLPPGLAFLLGAVLAGTDPVAVTAQARRLSLPGRLHTLVQAESLFNDATSLILFRVATSFVVAGGALSAADRAGSARRPTGGSSASSTWRTPGSPKAHDYSRPVTYSVMRRGLIRRHHTRCTYSVTIPAVMMAARLMSSWRNEPPASPGTP